MPNLVLHLQVSVVSMQLVFMLFMFCIHHWISYSCLCWFVFLWEHSNCLTGFMTNNLKCPNKLDCFLGLIFTGQKGNDVIMPFLLQYLTKMSKYFFLLSPDLMPEMKVIAVTLKDMPLSSVCSFKGLHLAHWPSDSSVHQLNGILVMEISCSLSAMWELSSARLLLRQSPYCRLVTQ